MVDFCKTGLSIRDLLYLRLNILTAHGFRPLKLNSIIRSLTGEKLQCNGTYKCMVANVKTTKNNDNNKKK
jgi:hypothetical protein